MCARRARIILAVKRYQRTVYRYVNEHDWFMTRMDDRIGVAQLIWSLDPTAQGGGADYYGLRLALHLDPTRFRSSICALWELGTAAEKLWVHRLRRSGIQVHFLARHTSESFLKKRTQAVRALVPYLEQHRPEVVTCHLEAADLLVLYALLRLKRPPLFVRTVHSEREWSTFPLLGRLLRQISLLIYDCEVGVSDRVTTQLKHRLLVGYLKRTPICLQNGIDIDEIVAERHGVALRSELGIPATSFVVGSVGRLEPQKGYEWLIDAFSVFVQSVDAHFILVGDGSLHRKLMQRIHALGMQERVFLLGGRVDRLSMIGQFDVFVSSSLWEGLSTAVMEAMVLETPVIATAVSGNVDLILPRHTGLLIPPGNVTACVEALMFIYQQPEERQGLVRAARAHVERFRFGHTVERYATVYEELVKCRRSNRGCYTKGSTQVC
jgi:glycosyltransferase involved in cell wall biosynthesis